MLLSPPQFRQQHIHNITYVRNNIGNIKRDYYYYYYYYYYWVPENPIFLFWDPI